MIYLFTEKITKKKTIFIKDTSALRIGDGKEIELKDGIYVYSVDNQVFADISFFPTFLHGTDDDINNIAQYYFQNCELKKFDSVDFFSAYIVYIMSTVGNNK